MKNIKIKNNINTLKQYLKTAGVFFGAFLIIYGTTLLFTSNFNMGIVFVIMLGAVLALLCALKKMPVWLKIVLWSVIIFAVVSSVFVTAYGLTDTVTGDEDALIVLGAAVNGEIVGAQLARRLDVAYDYYLQNPDVLIVVSGGRGAQEDITEALAMQRYLVAKGVPEANIIKEELATGTDYNFKYSKQLLDEILGDEYKTAFVTTDYHIFRAEFTAHKQGFDSVTHAHSSVDVWYYLPSTLREVVAIICYWLLK